MKKSRLFLCAISAVLCITIFAFAGCQNSEPETEPSESSGNTPVSSESEPESTSEEDTAEPSVFEPSSESQHFEFTGNTMGMIEIPKRGTVIPQFRKDMGEKPTELSENQIVTLTDKINSLTLKEYDVSKSVVETVEGGGITVEFYYNTGNVIYNFISSDIIEVTEENKETVYYKADSNNYREFIEFLTAIM